MCKMPLQGLARPGLARSGRPVFYKMLSEKVRSAREDCASDLTMFLLRLIHSLQYQLRGRFSADTLLSCPGVAGCPNILHLAE